MIIAFTIVAATVAIVLLLLLLYRSYNLSPRKALIPRINRVLCDSSQALDISGPLRLSHSSLYPGKFMPQLETEASGQKPSLRKAQVLTHQLNLCPGPMIQDVPTLICLPLHQAPVHESQVLSLTHDLTASA